MSVEEKGIRMLNEFREFAMKGNVVDLAVGVIIGAAFGAIVNSLVGDVIMPMIGAATGGLDFSNYFTPLSKAVTATNLADAKKQGAVLAWGSFLTLTINFVNRLRVVPGDPPDESVEAQGAGGARCAAQALGRGRVADRDPRSPQEVLTRALQVTC